MKSKEQKQKKEISGRGHLVLGVIQATNRSIVKRQNEIKAKAKCKK